jgi:predicted NUDIX family NTP pyrophosphohydrolase
LSAGILLYRIKNHSIEVLLAHSGGPFFAKKDEGHWSIPKGEPDSGEELIDTARREFFEETGLKPEGNMFPLGSIVQKGGKEVFGWAIESDLPAGHEHTANMVTIDWPPGSGKKLSFPEIDRIEFFSLEDAKRKIKEAQIPLIERLVEHLGL